MLIDRKEKFLIKSTRMGNIKATQDLYKMYSYSSDRFHDAALLYQQILTSYAPKEAIKILLIDGDIERLKSIEIETGFVNAYSIVSDYMAINKFYSCAVHWAKKGMDLFDFFHSKYPDEILVNLKRNSKDYQNLKKIFEENASHFCYDFYYGYAGHKGLTLEWESNYVPSIHHDNDNLVLFAS